MSLVAWYRMSENAASTYVEDASGNANHGTSVRNTSLMASVGKVGGALAFTPASTDWIEGPALSALSGSITYAAWCLCNNPTVKSGIVDCLNSSTFADGSAFVTKYSVNGIGYYSPSTGWKWAASNILLPAGVWAHAAVVVAATVGGTIYLNGVSVYSWNDTTSAVVAPTQGLRIGKSYDAGYFDGLMDDVRIYNEALTLAQIKFIYNAGMGSSRYAPWQGDFVSPLVRPLTRKVA